MRGQRRGLSPPLGEAEQDADPDPSEARFMGPLGSIKTPVEILLRTRQMKSPVGLPVISLLIDHKPLGTRGNKRDVVGGLHWGNLKGEARNITVQALDAPRQILSRDEFGMFPSHEQDVAESLRGKVTSFGRDLLDLQGHAEDRLIFPGKSAIGAGIDALVGKVKGGEQPHRPPEMAAGQRGGTSGHLLERRVTTRLQQTTEGRKLRGRRGKCEIEERGKGHVGILMQKEE